MLHLSLTAQKRFAWIRAAFWLVAFAVVAYTGNLESIAILSFVSFYANVAGEWANAQAISAEERVQADEERQGRMEDKIDEILRKLNAKG